MPLAIAGTSTGSGSKDGLLTFRKTRLEAEVYTPLYLDMVEDGSWYWDLKPDYRFGEVFEI